MKELGYKEEEEKEEMSRMPWWESEGTQAPPSHPARQHGNCTRVALLIFNSVMKTSLSSGAEKVVDHILERPLL